MLDQTITTQDAMVMVLWVMGVGIAGLVIAILVQVLFLLRDVNLFVRDAQDELKPMMRDIPAITSHVESMTAQAEKGVASLGEGLDQLKTVPSKIQVGVSALVGGLARSFSEE